MDPLFKRFENPWKSQFMIFFRVLFKKKKVIRHSGRFRNNTDEYILTCTGSTALSRTIFEIGSMTPKTSTLTCLTLPFWEVVPKLITPTYFKLLQIIASIVIEACDVNQEKIITSIFLPAPPILPNFSHMAAVHTALKLVKKFFM